MAQDWRAVNDWGCNGVHWAALQGNLPMCRESSCRVVCTASACISMATC